MAGKTGTTDDDKDRWFAGYTPDYTAVVWCGYDQPQEVVLTDESIKNPASVLFQRVLSQISQPDNGFYKPSNIIEVELCQDSGLLPTGWCENDLRGDRTVTVMMAAEDVPTEYCSTHVEQSVCHSEGTYHLASENCEREGDVSQYGLLNYNRQFPLANFAVEDQQYCVGYLARQTGYSTPRCGSTLDPVNKLCPYHSTSDEEVIPPSATPVPTPTPESEPEPDPEPDPEPTDSPNEQDNEDGQAPQE